MRKKRGGRRGRGEGRVSTKTTAAAKERGG